MDFVVRMDVLEQIVQEDAAMAGRTRSRSIRHPLSAIQKATWRLAEVIKAGTKINRLPAEDLPKFQRLAVPIWFKWPQGRRCGSPLSSCSSR